MAAVPWINPRYCGFGRLASSMSFVLSEESYVDAFEKNGLCVLYCFRRRNGEDGLRHPSS